MTCELVGEPGFKPRQSSSRVHTFCTIWGNGMSCPVSLVITTFARELNDLHLLE